VPTRTSDLPPSGDLTIAIATINSSRYIDIILRYYREHGIAVTLFVDDRSVDDSLGKARELAPDAISTSNPGGFIAEGLLQKMSRACPTKWLLRIDDDELPSLAMMDFARNAGRNDTPDVYAFPRQQCAVSRKGALLRHGEVSPHDHRQWRLYQPARVEFTRGLHTPGIVWGEQARAVTAPLEASLIHLDWAVHSYHDRRRKVERYDAHTANAGTKWRSYYLYEEEPFAPATFSELPWPEFRQTAFEISQRFPDLCLEV
jgi:hypothetical protein